MTSNSCTTLVIALIAATAFTASPLAARSSILKVSGCELLAHPSRYDGRVVSVYGLVNTDLEHFDLRFTCRGYIALEISTSEADAKKFGFKTSENENYHTLVRSTANNDAIGPTCLQCNPTNKRNVVHATVVGLFRCHYDFPDCSDVSPYGDSSLVIASVKSVKITSSE